MSSVSEFKVGQGVLWVEGHRKMRHKARGLVIGNDGTMLHVVPVASLSGDVKCYDEGGADPDRDYDNVRLRHCSAANGPFTELCEDSDRNGCYAYANLDKVKSISDAFIGFNHVEVVDDGVLVHKDDMQDVLDHLWRDEKQAGSGPVVQQESTGNAVGAGCRMLGWKRAPDDPLEPEEGLEAVEAVGRLGDMVSRLEELARKRVRQKEDAGRPGTEPPPDEPSLESRTAALASVGKQPDTGHDGLGS